MPIEQVKEEAGLPEDASFLGYVVHLPRENEFLAYSENSAGIVRRAFGKTPDQSKIFSKYKAAKREAAKCKQKAETWQLFDIGEQYVVLPVE